MRFFAYGHRNVLATHKTTVEFTKDGHLTKKGDCILGIRADFGKPQGLSGRIMIIISAAGLRDEITAIFNEGFDSDEMVIRKSGFLDKRTFATGADKAACDIDRRIVEWLNDPEKRILIEINNY